MTEREALENFVANPTTGCWIWCGGSRAGKKTEEYGRFWDSEKRISGRSIHRVSLEAKLGRPIRPGMLACHTCDTPSCIRPEHLFEGTYRDNYRDSRAKGRHAHGCGRPRPSMWGSKHHAAKLVEADVLLIRSSRLPDRKLASIYGVSYAAISAIRNMRNWKHLPGRTVEPNKPGRQKKRTLPGLQGR